MKKRKVIGSCDVNDIENQLNGKYADWEIAKAFYDGEGDFLLLIMEREVEEDERA